MSKIAAIIGRILLGLLFIASGIGKLADLGGAEQMLVNVGLSGNFAGPIGIFELVAGLCLVFGFMVRLVAILLLVFVAATILFFHNRFTEPAQAMAALKNLAIMGGLLLAFAHSQMWSHYYSIKQERKGELAALDAEKRAHEAELRAARAEGVAAAHGGAPALTDGDVHVETSRRRRWFDW